MSLGTAIRPSTPPQGPKGHWLLGSLPDLHRDQLGFYARCAREYGDVVPVRMGPVRGVLIYHPDAIEHTLVTRSRGFLKSRPVRPRPRHEAEAPPISEVIR